MKYHLYYAPSPRLHGGACGALAGQEQRKKGRVKEMSDSRIIAEDFEYFVAKNMEEAVSLLAKHGQQARVIAGGTDLLVGIKTGKVQPDCLINIRWIEGMGKLDESEKGLTIGAGCLFHQIESSRLVRDQYTALYEAVQSVSSTQIKNMGTIGGNICNGSPAADSAPALLVLGARARIIKPGGERVLSLDDFFVNPGETALSRDEILKEIEIPFWGSGTGSAFLKIGRVSADLAKVNAAVLIKRNGDVCEECRIALGSVAKTPMRTKGAETWMRGQRYHEGLAREVAQKASEEIFPITDIRSTKEYRKEVSKIIVRDALERAWERAGREA